MNKALSVAILFCITFSISNAEIYKWLDENGKIHYGDKAPNDDILPLKIKHSTMIDNISPKIPVKPESLANNIIPDNGEYQSTKHSISGKLLFNGKPITVNKAADVNIWMRDEGTGKSANIQVIYSIQDSSIYVENVTPGKYGMSINADINKSNKISYPGDYRAWANFTIRDGYSIKRNINMDKIIHLTEPQNNNKIINGWENPCDKKMAFDAPITIRWKPLGENVNYKYVVSNNPCKPFRFGDIIKHGSTTESFVTLELPKTNQNHQYMLDIKAYRNKRLIGSLITHGNNGYGWDYRFLIK